MGEQFGWQRVSRRQLLAGGALVLLAGCARQPRYSQPQEGFRRYSADDVVRAFHEAGLNVGGVSSRPIATATPNPDLPRIPRVREGGPASEPMVEVEARNFAIPGQSERGKGGRIFVFDSPDRLRAKQIWFARFPDLYPYVYPHANVLIWLDGALPATEAERYRQALEALP